MERLLDGAGAAVADYLRVERDHRPCADLIEPRAPVDAVAAALLAGRAGWLATTGHRALVDALLAGGARLRRHAWMLQLELERVAPREPAVLAGVTLEPLRDVPPALAAVNRAAYPPGHPDHEDVPEEQTLEDLRDYVLGRDGWTSFPASVLALRGHEHVGAVIMDSVSVPGHEEPVAWVTELFRAPGPELRGLGAVLLDAAVAAVRATPTTVVGLAVSDGNPAAALYRRRGFETAAETWTLDLPGAVDRR